ncbi:tyrosine-type recombinase/integrase [Streptomyces laurentii]
MGLYSSPAGSAVGGEGESASVSAAPLCPRTITQFRRAATDEERGEFVDPRDGSITLADYIATHWAPGRGGAPKTQDSQERRWRLHIVPHLGQLPLRSIAATDLRAFIAKLESTVSSVDYQRGILSELSSILEAAVDDKRLARNPMHAKSVRWPKSPRERRDAWPMATALRVRDAINKRNRIAVVVGLGCGLRQGEVFGLSPEGIDHGRGLLHVRRQVQAIHGRLYFALPKGKKIRTVDLPPSVAEELKRHIEAFPPVGVELPWGKPEREREKFSLLLTTRFGNAVAVNTWNTYTWKSALAKAGVIPPRAKGVESLAVGGGPKGRLPCASAHLRLDHVGSRRIRRDPGAVARAFLAGDHPRLLCSLHAGGRQQGARHHRRPAWGAWRPARWLNSPDSPQRR